MTTPYETLNNLMHEMNHREIECRQFLTYTRDKLVKNPPDRFIRFESEYRGHAGDSDVIITCETKNDAGIACIEAYIWEVKAPQCFIFEFDNNNRVKPTRDLISAENQLLHYYEEYKGSNSFKEEFQITNPENIHIGGIIIGQKSTIVKPDGRYRPEQINSLYTRAINCRKQHFYKASRIDFIVWDRILDLIRRDGPVSTEERIVEQIGNTDARFDVAVGVIPEV